MARAASGCASRQRCRIAVACPGWACRHFSPMLPRYLGLVVQRHLHILRVREAGELFGLERHPRRESPTRRHDPIRLVPHLLGRSARRNTNAPLVLLHVPLNHLRPFFRQLQARWGPRRLHRGLDVDTQCDHDCHGPVVPPFLTTHPLPFYILKFHQLPEHLHIRDPNGVFRERPGHGVHEQPLAPPGGLPANVRGEIIPDAIHALPHIKARIHLHFQFLHHRKAVPARHLRADDRLLVACAEPGEDPGKHDGRLVPVPHRHHFLPLPIEDGRTARIPPLRPRRRVPRHHVVPARPRVLPDLQVPPRPLAHHPLPVHLPLPRLQPVRLRHRPRMQRAEPGGIERRPPTQQEGLRRRRRILLPEPLLVPLTLRPNTPPPPEHLPHRQPVLGDELLLHHTQAHPHLLPPLRSEPLPMKRVPHPVRRALHHHDPLRPRNDGLEQAP